MLQNMLAKDGLGALSLLRSADYDCLHLVELCLDLELYLHSVMDQWTASVTYRPYALDPDFDQGLVLLLSIFGHCCWNVLCFYQLACKSYQIK